MSNAQLKPCPVPWCGACPPDVELTGYRGSEFVICGNCGCQGKEGDSASHAIQLWNHRQASADRARIERLEAALRRAEQALTCRSGDAHYCPNCDNTTFNAREDVRAALKDTDHD